MFYNEIDLTNPDTIKKFSLANVKHEYTFEHYYYQYNCALRTIFQRGLKGQYELNIQALPILFLLRHSFELCLKLNLTNKQIQVPETHEFKELVKNFPAAGVVSNEFIQCLGMLDKDPHGAAFRYLTDGNTGKSYFKNSDRIEVAPLLKLYNSILRGADFTIGEIAAPFDYDSKVHAWDLTFHVGRNFSIGNVRAEYDSLTVYLTKAILNDEVKVEDIYLPYLYLLRHSLELALKSNITDVKPLSEKLKSKDIQKEHSLATLYNLYNGYLEGVGVNKLSQESQEQLKKFKEEYQRLNSTMHQLDSNSRYFKYPVAKAGAPHANPFDFTKIDLAAILSLRYFTHPFLVFTNLVLNEEGVHQI